MQDEDNRPGAAGVLVPTESTALPSLDPDRYRAYLAEFNLSREEEAELLAMLWRLMSAFVDLGFGTDSVQRILPALAESALMSESDQVGEEEGRRAAAHTVFNASAGKEGRA